MQPVIRSDADVAEGARWLAKTEPRFAEVLKKTGPLPLRLRPGGFSGLLDITISQQVSVASADAIRLRVAQAGLNSEEQVRAAGEAGMRDAGLSRPKARYAVILAGSALDYDGLQAMSDADAMATLTAIKGIGPWTAQIYAMFALGRRDIFPAGDLALQIAAQALLELNERPKPEALATLAQEWSPWRSVAARALFAYYRVLKNREGLG
ncbi:MAG: DNA-3-methyladenine glycosylase 2 family protein [Sulfitobacter sp.]